MAGCHNSPRGAFLLLSFSATGAAAAAAVPPPSCRRATVHATPVLEDNFSKSRSPALIALMMNEASQPSGAVEAARRALYGLSPRAAAHVCHPCSTVRVWERVRTRRYRRRTSPPQGHSRYDEDHSRKEWKVFCIYLILYFRPLMEKYILWILCKSSQFQQILNVYVNFEFWNFQGLNHIQIGLIYLWNWDHHLFIVANLT